jgi:hypothetical protein
MASVLGNCPRHFLDRRGTGKAGHDDGRLARDLSGIIGNDDLGRRKFGPSCGVDIEADHAPSALDEVTRDRTSHDAKPDNSNGPVHEGLSCLSNWIDGISDQAINNRQAA